MSKKVIIIGSGIAGLALSVRLKVKGYDVHVFEKNESYGGKLYEFKLGEYRYDFGPKLFTLPELLIDLFKISNHNIFNPSKLKIPSKQKIRYYVFRTGAGGKPSTWLPPGDS